MDVLGDMLAPWSDLLAKFAGTVTCLQFMSGVVLMNDIRKKGCSDVYPIGPFMGGVVLTVLGAKLGSIIGDHPMINVNIIGFAINIVFLGIFYWYASNENKMKIWKQIGIAALFTMAGLIYANFEDPEKVEVRLGTLITGILVLMVGAPLLSIDKIIQKKSTEGMPFPIIFSGVIVSISWTLYGLSIKNEVMLYQNLLLLALSIPQLALFAIYPNTSTSDGKTIPVKVGLPSKTKLTASNKKDN